jgi:nucleotide-binding universal stress UspA family protein
MYRHILVPLDGSALAERALAHAVHVAKMFGSDITLLQVVPSAYTPPVPDLAAVPPVTLIEQLRQDAEQYLKTRQNELRSQGIAAHRTILEGPVAEAILGYAESQPIELVVMCTHGRGGLSRWVYGSVAEKVLHSIRCPVLLIRAVE